jgi:hypothetical protein
MSQRPISRSADLKRLQDEGYDLQIRSGYLLIRSVPYVNAAKEIKFGTIVSKLTLANDVTVTPVDHVAYFIGEYPCQADGIEIERIRNSSNKIRLDADLEVDHTFSAKPKPSDTYVDYYAKMMAYVAILSGPAQSIDGRVTARTFPVIEAKGNESVFNYIDTASSRAGINAVTEKLELGKIAIVGVGGTGSYVLDLVAKTPVREIHLFDGDTFYQHNAFRSPGAASGDQLEQKLNKAVYFSAVYSKMRRGVIAHDSYIDTGNVDMLNGAQFVFLCLDRGDAKRLVVERLEQWAIPFVDVGMGVYVTDGSLGGILRVTTSTPDRPRSAKDDNRIPFSDGDGWNNEYVHNIQIADLNALNAALAVIRWKKLFRFYHDLDHEHHSTYTIDGNALTNEDKYEARHPAHA